MKKTILLCIICLMLFVSCAPDGESHESPDDNTPSDVGSGSQEVQIPNESGTNTEVGVPSDGKVRLPMDSFE